MALEVANSAGGALCGGRGGLSSALRGAPAFPFASSTEVAQRGRRVQAAFQGRPRGGGRPDPAAVGAAGGGAAGCRRAAAAARQASGGLQWAAALQAAGRWARPGL